MPKRETLVILTPAFPENEADSNWLPAHHQLVKAIKNQFPGISIVVLTFLYPHQAARYDWNGISVVSFSGMGKKGWGHIQLWRQVWRELRKVRREHRVIGLFSFWCGECALIGHYFGLLTSIRHRCWLSGGDAQKGNKWVKLIRPKARELVAMSNFLRQLFKENYGIEPASVIPNGIDATIFADPNGAGATRDIDILAVGSLVPLKQYEMLVRVVAALRSQFPRIKAIHCGGGEERDHLQSLITSLGLEHNLGLLGEIPHREVLQLMQRAKVFLHPSSSEGFSTVCLEALYAGVRVISFCDPLDKRVPEWQIVKDETEMIMKTREILADPPESTPVLLHSLEDNARSVMKLFS